MQEASSRHLQEALGFMPSVAKFLIVRSKAVSLCRRPPTSACMRPSAYAKGPLSCQSYQVGLQLGPSVINKRTQNFAGMVKQKIKAV